MSPCIKDNVMWHNMPSQVQNMELVHVPPQSNEPMVSLLDEEHLVHQGGKVLVVSQEGVKMRIGLLLEVTPRGRNVL